MSCSKLTVWYLLVEWLKLKVLRTNFMLTNNKRFFFFSNKKWFWVCWKSSTQNQSVSTLNISISISISSASAQVQCLTSSCTVYIMIQWIFYIFLLFLSFYSSWIVWCWWLKAFNFTFPNGPIALMSNKNPKTGRKYFLLFFSSC